MAGAGFALMVTSCEVVPVQPLALVTVTVYVPAVVGLILAVAAPLLQAYELKPAVALSVALAPWQTAKVPDMDGIGFWLMVTVWDAVPLQPPAAVTVTVYVPAVFGLMEDVLAPLLH